MSHVKIQTEHAPAAGLILAAGLGYAAWVQATGQGVPCPVPCADGAVLSGLRHHALPQCPFAGQLAGCPAQQCRHSGAGAFFCLAGLGGGAQLPYRRQRAADKAAECRRVRGHCSAGGLWHCAKSAGLLVFAPACLTVTTEKKTAPLWPENRLQRCSFLDALRRRAGAQGLAEQPVLCAVPN